MRAGVRHEGLGLLLLLVCGTAAPAHGQCTLPPAPSKIPSGAMATEAEMRTTMIAMSHYETDVNNYIKCLAFEAAQGRLSPQAQASLTAEALDRHQAVIKRFNEQMRVYMAR